MNGVVIIPAYNPDEKICKLVDTLWGCEIQTIVVDDGSSEESEKYFDAVLDIAIVIHHSENRGKGAAIKTGLKYIQNEMWDTDVVGIMDADGQHLPKDMLKLMKEARKSSRTLVLGVRKLKKGMPLKSRIGNGITRKIFRLVSGREVSDTQTGLRAFDKNLIQILLDVPGERYEYETNVLLYLIRQQIDIMEIQIAAIYFDDQNSCSHFRAVKDSFRIYKDIIQFALSSISSFVMDYVLFIVFTFLFGATGCSLIISNIAARIVSGFCNYQMNSRFVFHHEPDRQNGISYILLASGILIGNNFLLCFCESCLNIPACYAKLLTEFTLFMISFLVQKKVIYRKKLLTKQLYDTRVKSHSSPHACMKVEI